jgi:hypothetical protein
VIIRTALATEVFLGDPMRFSDGKALASYIGMIIGANSCRKGLGKPESPQLHQPHSGMRPSAVVHGPLPCLLTHLPVELVD